MKRIVIICEGETEQEFCNKILNPYLAQKGIYIYAPLIKHTHGGIVKWTILKKQIESNLLQDPKAYVTLFIDYYGITEEHMFPLWNDAHKVIKKIERIKLLEKGMNEDICEDLNLRFIPYMQLHEFEALLFCDANAIIDAVDDDELNDKDDLIGLIDSNPNPEMINNSKYTSPSHRMERYIIGYNKIVYGNIIAENIGIDMMREKCKHFNEWISAIENIKK